MKHFQILLKIFFPLHVEHLNIIFFKLSQQYHTALSKVDLTGYAASTARSARGGQSQNAGNAPVCEHGAPTKMVCVKKDGANKGRFFYVCSSPRGSQCKVCVVCKDVL